MLDEHAHLVRLRPRLKWIPDHATQRAAIERAAAARGDAIHTWYAEKKSAKTMNRPELTRLRADARAGDLKKLFVFRLDRLTRSGIRDTFELVEELRAHGVENRERRGRLRS